MHKQGLDVVLVSPSSDFLYLVGHRGHLSERLTLFAIPASGQPVMVSPLLESPLARSLATYFTVRTWADHEDPYAVVRSVIPAASRAIAVSDQMWSVHLLRLQSILPQASFSPASGIITPLRRVKDETEIAAIRRAGAAVDAVMADIVKLPLIGRSERDLAQHIGQLLLDHGHQQVGFAIAASGPNGGSPHHISGDRVIQKGDALVLDFGGVFDNYISDITRTLFLGTPSEEYRKVYEVVRQAQELAVHAVRPGVACQDIDRAARRRISAAGYGDYFIHRTGHGLGLDGHEEPYMVEGNTLPLAPGMVFSVEPGIYLPGRFGVRIEDIVVVTETGVERLNHAPRELIALEQ